MSDDGVRWRSWGPGAPLPKVRKLVETEAEVLLTEKGEPNYRLILYTAPTVKDPAPVDYWGRLNAYQP